MLKLNQFDVVDFKIGKIKTYPKGLDNDVFHTRVLTITEKDGHILEITLYTNDEKETLLPKRMEED